MRFVQVEDDTERKLPYQLERSRHTIGPAKSLKELKTLSCRNNEVKC